jgi:hypothetical protein
MIVDFELKKLIFNIHRIFHINTHRIIAQHICNKKSKRFSSANKKSQSLKTSNDLIK